MLPPGAQDILVILLINTPDNLERYCNKHKRTEALLRSFVPNTSCPEVVCYDSTRCIDILVIDLVSPGRRVPYRKGVGAIRKFGADIALGLIHNQQIRCPWIFCTDADVCLPDGYFQVPENASANSRDLSAVVLPYKHFVSGDCAQCFPDLKTASMLYELHLRYFTNRLEWSGSPYAYPALGSLLIISAIHYAMVRGFPSRPAAEDFYLLNKLAKVGLIACPNQPVVKLQARRSTRVPFGTGPALEKILNSGERLTYAPQSFGLLQLFYTQLGAINNLPDSLQGLWSSTFHDNPEAKILLQVLDKIGFGDFITHQLKHCKSTSRFVRAIHEWFDAFRILKFLHTARDLGHADVPVLEALAEVVEEAGSTSQDYLAFLCNLAQSESQFRGLGRNSEIFSR